jgi:hypothetical protein
MPRTLVRWFPGVWFALLALWCPGAAAGSVVLAAGGAKVVHDLQQRCRVLGASAWEIDGAELLHFDSDDAELVRRTGRDALSSLSAKFGQSVMVLTDFSLFDAFEASLLGEMQYEEFLCSLQSRGIVLVSSSRFLLISMYQYVVPWWPADGARPELCNYSIGTGDIASLNALFAAHNGSLLARVSSSPNQWAPFLETEWPWFFMRAMPAAVLVGIILYALLVAGLLGTRPAPMSAVVQIILFANITMLSAQLALVLLTGGIWGFLSESRRVPVAAFFFMSGPGAGLSLLLGLYIDKILASTRYMCVGFGVLGVMVVLDIVNDYYIGKKNAPYVVYYIGLPALQLFFIVFCGAFLAKRLVALQAHTRTHGQNGLDPTTTRIRRRLISSGTLSLVGISFTFSMYFVLQLGLCTTPQSFSALAVMVFMGRCAVAIAQILFCDRQATFCTGLSYFAVTVPDPAPSALNKLSQIAATTSILGASRVVADERAASATLVRAPSKRVYSFGGHE